MCFCVCTIGFSLNESTTPSDGPGTDIFPSTLLQTILWMVFALPLMEGDHVVERHPIEASSISHLSLIVGEKLLASSSIALCFCV